MAGAAPLHCAVVVSAELPPILRSSFWIWVLAARGSINTRIERDVVRPPKVDSLFRLPILALYDYDAEMHKQPD